MTLLLGVAIAPVCHWLTHYVICLSSEYIEGVCRAVCGVLTQRLIGPAIVTENPIGRHRMSMTSVVQCLKRISEGDL